MCGCGCRNCNPRSKNTLLYENAWGCHSFWITCKITVHVREPQGNHMVKKTMRFPCGCVFEKLACTFFCCWNAGTAAHSFEWAAVPAQMWFAQKCIGANLALILPVYSVLVISCEPNWKHKQCYLPSKLPIGFHFLSIVGTPSSPLQPLLADTEEPNHVTGLLRAENKLIYTSFFHKLG